MPADPRCPSCNGKISARATWCMHCGEDLEGESNAGPERTRVQVDQSGSDNPPTTDYEALDNLLGWASESEFNRGVLGVAIGFVAWYSLVNSGLVAPGNPFLALAGATGLAAYLVTRDDAATVLVHGVYGVGAVLLFVRVTAAILYSGTVSLPVVLAALLDGSTLFVLAGVGVAGRWIQRELGVEG